MFSIEQTLETATRHHRAGELAVATELYRDVLAQSPGHSLAAFRLGLIELQSGRPERALGLIEHAAAEEPAEPRFRHGLGQVLLALGRWTDAAVVYRALALEDPTSVDAHYSLGVALQSQRLFSDAAVAYEAAVSLDASLAEGENNLGICRQEGGAASAAEASYRRALALRPGYAGAMSNLGVLLRKTGRIDAAIPLLRDALSLEPSVGAHRLNLGAAFCALGQHADARAVLGPLVEAEPSNAEAHFNLANALQGLGIGEEAEAAYGRALAIEPQHVDALINLGNLLRSQGELNRALEAYEQALTKAPDSVAAANNKGCVLRSLGRMDDAEATFRRALQLSGEHPVLLDNLGSVLKDGGDLAGAIECYRTAVRLDPTNPGTHSNLAYSLSFQVTDGRTVLAECTRWAERFAAPLYASIRPHGNDRSSERKLRIGYVSPDFRDHCQSLFTIPVLRHHDRTRHEVVCYSSVERRDDVTRLIAALPDLWREVRSLDDARLAELVRSDGIDVLVDLTMHMADGRPLLFARKPAPVQVAWLAYPGTTGIRAIDYRLTDPHLDTDEMLADYAERSIRLPDSFWCYDPRSSEPVRDEPPAIGRGYVTFGCLNNPCKLTDATLDLWKGVMAALPDAHLQLMAPAGRFRSIVLERLARRGIVAARVEFVEYRPRGNYLQSYHGIDIGLDTIPYNGHTTSLDAMWMGVPVVSRIGATCVGRGGLSQLSQLDLGYLATRTDQDFVARAVELAGNLPALASLRRSLRARMADSPLMDGARFARGIEAAYRQAWIAYCTGS